MPSIISIGFVYENFKTVEDELDNIISSLINDKQLINKIEYSLSEEDDAQWITLVDVNKEKINYKQISEGYYSCLEFISNYFLDIESNISIRVEKNEECYAILVELLENDFLINKDSLELLTHCVIKYVNSLINVSDFSYSFCDHDSNLEYTPDEIRKSYKETYSLIFIRNGIGAESRLDTYFSEWHIDGHTPRKIITL